MTDEDFQVKFARLELRVSQTESNLREVEERLEKRVEEKNDLTSARVEKVEGNLSKGTWAVIALVINEVIRRAGIGL